MDTGTWTLAVGGAIGLALTLFGITMLVTRRAPASTTRSFRDVHDAGLYHLLFGLGLLLLVAGTRLPGRLTGVATALLALSLTCRSRVWYQPSGNKYISQRTRVVLGDRTN